MEANLNQIKSPLDAVKPAVDAVDTLGNAAVLRFEEAEPLLHLDDGGF